MWVQVTSWAGRALELRGHACVGLESAERGLCFVGLHGSEECSAQ